MNDSGKFWGLSVQYLDGYIQAYTFVKTHQTVHLRCVHFTVCKLHLKFLKLGLKMAVRN